MWGGEAVAIRHDGRANPNQLMLTPATQRSIAGLARRARCRRIASALVPTPTAISISACRLRTRGASRGPMSGTNRRRSRRVTIRFSIRRFAGGVRVLTDAEIDRIVDDYAPRRGSRMTCGFQFVDAKACHGYLGHEMLGATTRPGKYGGSLENRMRFITADHRRRFAAPRPGLRIVVRVSIFDLVPHERVANGVGVPEQTTGDEPGFGVLRTKTWTAR